MINWDQINSILNYFYLIRIITNKIHLFNRRSQERLININEALEIKSWLKLETHRINKIFQGWMSICNNTREGGINGKVV